MWFITINEGDQTMGETLIVVGFFHITCHRRPTVNEIRKSFNVDEKLTVTISPITFARFNL